MKANSVIDLIGNTPLLSLASLVEPGSAQLLGKLEARNPSGSVKDRAVLAMIEDAEARGVLRPGCTIVEATSGNFGIALAMVGAARIGEREVLAMAEEVGWETLHAFAAEWFDLFAVVASSFLARVVVLSLRKRTQLGAASFLVSLVGGLGALAAVSQWAFLEGWWFPAGAPALAWLGSVGFVTAAIPPCA